MKKSGLNLNNLKKLNRGMVLRKILLEDKPNRSDISLKLNLTKTTLTNVVSELIGDGIIEESALIESELGVQGRKSVSLDIAPKSPVICALMVQRERIAIALIDLKGKSLRSEVFSYEGLISVVAFKDGLQNLFKRISYDNDRPIFAIGISAFGPIDKEKGLLLRPQNFFDTDVVFNIVEYMENISGIKTFLSHDVASATLAEKLYGNARDKDNFLFVSTIAGLGVGFFLNSSLYDGENGQNGELGHTKVGTINHSGDISNEIYIEKYLTNDALRDYAAEYYHLFSNHVVFSDKNYSINNFIVLAESGDALSQLVLHKYCKYLCSAISVLTTALGITNVYISNTEYSQTGYLEKQLEKELNSNSYVYDYQQTTVTRSKFCLDTSLYGAYAVVMDKIFNGNLYFIDKDGE